MRILLTGMMVVGLFACSEGKKADIAFDAGRVAPQEKFSWSNYWESLGTAFDTLSIIGSAQEYYVSCQMKDNKQGEQFMSAALGASILNSSTELAEKMPKDFEVQVCFIQGDKKKSFLTSGSPNSFEGCLYGGTENGEVIEYNCTSSSGGTLRRVRTNSPWSTSDLSFDNCLQDYGPGYSCKKVVESAS